MDTLPSSECCQQTFFSIKEQEFGNFIQNEYIESKMRSVGFIQGPVVNVTLDLNGVYVPCPLFSHHDLMCNIFNLLDTNSKKNVTEVCLTWGRWFAISKFGKKACMDYERLLEKENYSGTIWSKRGGRLIERYCICRDIVFDCTEDKVRFHRHNFKVYSLMYADQGLDEGTESVETLSSDEELCDCNRSGSEGYYDSDC